MRAIVTGGAGFIGSNLAMTLEGMGAKVLVIDDFSSGDFHNLAGFRGDVVSEDLYRVDWDHIDVPDCVFHEGANTDTTCHDQLKMMQTNVEATRKALVFAAKNQIPFIYASSAAQYGNLPAPQKDDGAVDPLNVYAFSKMMCDQLAMRVQAAARIPVVGLRYFNVFGPREKYKGKTCSMIYQLAEQMRAGKRPRIFHDGEQMRDHIYVKDVVACNLRAFESRKSGVFNLGTGKATSFNRIIEVLNQVLGTNYEPDYFDNPYGTFYQNKTQADVTRLKQVLGFETKYSIEEGIKDYLNEIYAAPTSINKNKREKLGLR